MLNIRLFPIALLLMIYTATTLSSQSVNWLEVDEGAQLSVEKNKIMLIYFYTDWCGFCKRLDQITFEDSFVKAKLDSHFIPMKFNAELQDSIIFMETAYSFVQEGRRGHHGFAGVMLENRMSYPTLVYVDPSGKVLHRSPGYREPSVMLKEMEFIIDGHYLKQSWKQYKASN